MNNKEIEIYVNRKKFILGEKIISVSINQNMNLVIIEYTKNKIWKQKILNFKCETCDCKYNHKELTDHSISCFNLKDNNW